MTAVASDKNVVTEKHSDRSGGDLAVEASSHVLLAIWTVIVIVPFLWVVLSSFKTTKEILASPFSLPAHWSFDNYVHAWTDAGIRQFFLNTVIVVGVSLVLVMLLGAMCAYVLARFEFPGGTAHLLPDAGRTHFPGLPRDRAAVLRPQEHRSAQHLPGLIMVYVAFALPFTVFFLYAFFKSLAGRRLRGGADGRRGGLANVLPDHAGRWPSHGMATVAIFNFLGLWNQFLLPVALNTDLSKYVLTQGMAEFASQAGYAVDFGALFAAVVITVVPVLIVLRSSSVGWRGLCPRNVPVIARARRLIGRPGWHP